MLSFSLRTKTKTKTKINRKREGKKVKFVPFGLVW